MYTPLSPILAADADESVEAEAVLARIATLAPILTTVARLAGQSQRTVSDPLAQGADLAGLLASLPFRAMRMAARDLQTLGVILQAGLLALEKARLHGQFNQAAAMLLHAEAASLYRQTLADLGYPPPA